MKSTKKTGLGIVLLLASHVLNAQTLHCYLPDEKPIVLTLNLPALNILHQTRNKPAFTVQAKLDKATNLNYIMNPSTYQLNIKTLAYQRSQQGKVPVKGSCKAVAAASQTPPKAANPPIKPATPKAPTLPQGVPSDAACGKKNYCKEMVSCAEAKFYLKQCSLSKLDQDDDGKPCENVCGK